MTYNLLKRCKIFGNPPAVYKISTESGVQFLPKLDLNQRRGSYRLTLAEELCSPIKDYMYTICHDTTFAEIQRTIQYDISRDHGVVKMCDRACW
jgi:hypothetical protein